MAKYNSQFFKDVSMKEFADLKVIDNHVHVRDALSNADRIYNLLEICNMQALSVASLSGSASIGFNPSCSDMPEFESSKHKLLQNLMTLYVKASYPGKIFAFGGLYHPLPGAEADHMEYSRQAERLEAIGFDGIKMIEAKPTARRGLTEALDSDVYDKFYSYLQKKGTPITIHVADPINFWDYNKVTEIQKARGWFYGSEKFHDKKFYHNEVENILNKFPNLKITFAHFYYHSENIERAAQILDRYPNVNYDLTPGGVIYQDFSKAPDKWRKFFIKYQDRILLGTDNNDDIGQFKEKVAAIRMFLETDNEFEAFRSDSIKGINLDSEILKKIYSGNFERIVGKKPARLNLVTIEEEYEYVIKIAEKAKAPRGVIEEAGKLIEGIRHELNA